MRTREEIEGDRIAISTVNADDGEQRFSVDLHERHLQLELLLDIRDQNERIISLLERQPRLVFIPTTANIHDIISEIKQELDRDA